MRLRPPPSPEELAAAEARLGAPLPPSLRDLFAHTDGITDESAVYAWCWPLARVVEENLRLRQGQDLPDPDSKLCFGDDGTGAPFFIRRLNGVWQRHVYVWNWIDAEPRVLADDLATFCVGWLDGAITT